MTSPHWIKYPRTPHHPRSPGVGSDDKVAGDLSALEGIEVVVTEKMDGENTTLYADGYHARSLDTGFHPSRSWLASFHATIAHQIPEGMRICGENLYARHSIPYEDLPSYFLAFSVWEGETCLSWDDTETLCTALGIATVPVLRRAPFSDALVRELEAAIDTGRQEGFVIRTAAPFTLNDFPQRVVKWVRAGHVESERHWRAGPLIPNGMTR